MNGPQITPATVAKAAGWDFNQNASLESLAAWEEYRQVPLNPGTHQTERDAFTSGFDAAKKAASGTDRTADALESLATANTASAWIAWATRPGHQISGNQREYIEKLLGIKPGAGQ